MNRKLMFFSFIFSTAVLAQSGRAQTTAIEILLSNAKPITLVGARAGEGYFSPDGKQLIFQSERYPGNPFFQIYSMNLETGKTQLLSTGKGKTTCSWFHPSMKKALFASTHLDPEEKKKSQQEFDERKNPPAHRYAWSYDEHYDIFEASLEGKILRRLTKEKGYDAEGAYSPDGKQIVFASNRLAYSSKLSDTEKAALAKDPSFFMDIYIMNADGTKVRRLTEAKGYDGGPFFSPDGRKITWRRFSENGQVAEVYTMNTDGTEQKQITKMGMMSWAPFFHSSGDYLVFASNKFGYSNFELFIVDADGKHEPVRVTEMEGFDGLPVFSPDGKKLAWTKRNDKGDSQIFLGEWNDSAARQLLEIEPKLNIAEVRKSWSPSIASSDIWRQVSYLASGFLQGRGTGTPSEATYTEELRKYFSGIGLEVTDQVFEFSSSVKLGETNRLVIYKGDGQLVDLAANKDFLPLSFSSSGKFAKGPVAFAGYGITAPNDDKNLAYDSYAGLEVQGKWVVVLRDIPQDVDFKKKVSINTFARLNHKAMIARKNGALGLIIVDGLQSQLMKLKFEGAAGDAALPVLNVSQARALEILGINSSEWRGLVKKLDAGELLNRETAVQLEAQVDLQLEKSKGRNTLALLKVPGAKHTLVIGAHGDHLAHGEQGNSLAKGDEEGTVHFGADDNASGVAGVMELADYFARTPSARKSLKQNLLFVVWSGEEIGLLGSNYFVKNNKTFKISANINMDMIGRYRDRVFIQGIGSSANWASEIEKANVHTQLAVATQTDPYLPTDVTPFYLAKIPGVSFFTGAHSEYHTPRDRVQTLNIDGLTKTVELVATLAAQVAAIDKLVPYQAVEAKRDQTGMRSFRVYLGSIPDYAGEGVKGVKISGTAKDSPAEKAGLLANDIIIKVGTQDVKNIYDYVYCLQVLKPNEKTPVTVLRGGKELTVDVVPVVR